MDISNMIAQEHHNVLGFKCCIYVYYLLLYHFSAWTAHAVFCYWNSMFWALLKVGCYKGTQQKDTGWNVCTFDRLFSVYKY